MSPQKRAPQPTAKKSLQRKKRILQRQRLPRQKSWQLRPMHRPFLFLCPPCFQRMMRRGMETGPGTAYRRRVKWSRLTRIPTILTPPATPLLSGTIGQKESCTSISGTWNFMNRMRKTVTARARVMQRWKGPFTDFTQPRISSTRMGRREKSFPRENWSPLPQQIKTEMPLSWSLQRNPQLRKMSPISMRIMQPTTETAGLGGR